jgi:hypothetical protein
MVEVVDHQRMRVSGRLSPYVRMIGRQFWMLMRSHVGIDRRPDAPRDQGSCEM